MTRHPASPLSVARGFLALVGLAFVCLWAVIFGASKVK